MWVRWSKDALLEIALGGGFFAVTLAVVIAKKAPATGYEVSIYTATPLLTWILLTAALLLSTVVIVQTRSDTAIVVATVLGGRTMTAVLSLPLIRGYYFLGPADSLTHLGWVRDISDGVIDPFSMLYPGYHSISLAVARLTGSSLEDAVMISMVVLFLAFLVFVPLVVKLLTASTRTMGFAAICTWFVLPVNNVATFIIPHTNSLALFYVPVVIFSLLLLLRSKRPITNRQKIRPAKVTLAVVNVGMLLFHIQHAINVLLLFIVICGIQFVAHRRAPDSRVSRHQSLYSQTALFAFFVSAWILTHEIVTRELWLTLRGLASGGVGTTATVAQRSGSLTQIGGSVAELFVKMFLVNAFVGVLILGFLLLAVRYQDQLRSEIRSVLAYFTVSLVPLTVLFGLYFFGTPKMSFRQMGFIYVVLTVLGALALAFFSDQLDRSFRFGRTTATVVLVICLVLSLMTVYGSPYIYRASPGVSEQEVNGYQTTLETRTDRMPLATLSTQPYREIDAIRGTERRSQGEYSGAGDGTLSPPSFITSDVSRTYPNDVFHVLITEREVKKEIEVYDQLNYQQSSLDTFEEDRNSNRIMSNGEVKLYVVSSE